MFDATTGKPAHIASAADNRPSATTLPAIFMPDTPAPSPNGNASWTSAIRKYGTSLPTSACQRGTGAARRRFHTPVWRSCANVIATAIEMKNANSTALPGTVT